MKSPLQAHNSFWKFAAAAMLAGLCQNPAWGICTDDWLSVSKIRDGSNIELHATNNQQYPITFSVIVNGEVDVPDAMHTVSETILGRQSHRVMVLPGHGIGDQHEIAISCKWTIGSRHAAHDDDHLYLLPYANGSSYRVLQGFESDWSHRGDEQFAVDFRMPEGTPVHAARSGIVVRIEDSWDQGCWNDRCDQFANFVVILHDDGTTGEYYHLQEAGALVNVGEPVLAGQLIGLSGNTGRTAAPHLHFAVYHATMRGDSQSIPVSFLSTNGIVYEPRNGHHYVATGTQINGD
jgi:hypothetical protein